MLEEIQKILVEALNLNESEVVASAHLFDDLGIDSLSAVELALELETTFDISITDEELAELKTVQDIIDIVESKKN